MTGDKAEDAYGQRMKIGDWEDWKVADLHAPTTHPRLSANNNVTEGTVQQSNRISSTGTLIKGTFPNTSIETEEGASNNLPDYCTTIPRVD